MSFAQCGQAPRPHGMTRLAQMILIINSNQTPYPSDDILVQGCLDNAKHPQGVL